MSAGCACDIYYAASNGRKLIDLLGANRNVDRRAWSDNRTAGYVNAAYRWYWWFTGKHGIG